MIQLLDNVARVTESVCLYSLSTMTFILVARYTLRLFKFYLLKREGRRERAMLAMAVFLSGKPLAEFSYIIGQNGASWPCWVARVAGKVIT